MQNKLNTMIAHLNSLPESAVGFSPVFLFKTAKEFKVPGRIIRESFLGNSKKLSPGKYGVDAVTVSEKPRKTYEKRGVNTVKIAKTPKLVKTSKEISETALTAREELIAKIAKRHMSERKLIKHFQVKEHTSMASQDETYFMEELEKLQKSSTMFQA